jgi:hypothetical protein
MFQENVEIVRRGFQAFADNDLEGWFAAATPDLKIYPRPEEPGVKSCSKAGRVDGLSRPLVFRLGRLHRGGRAVHRCGGVRHRGRSRVGIA